MMSLRKLCRLYSTGMLSQHAAKRFYSSRNILSLNGRGMFQDMFPDTSSDEIKKLLITSPQSVYAGFDPTADSLHIGNLLILMNLLHWQRSGHQVIAVIGGATGKIGDPSHRVKEREEIDNTVLSDNVESIKNEVKKIFSNHEKYLWSNTHVHMKPLIVLNNMDWYKELHAISFIKGIGKYFRLGTMMGRSSVQSRLNAEGGMSFTEFTYQVFQAYDWLYLLSKYDCRFQIGGNDQMGNIMSGHELISRTTKKKVYGLTLPLITTEGGKKFGKSIGKAIWLSPQKSSCFNFYQFFVRTTDADVENYLKLFTFLSLKEIETIMNRHTAEPEKRIAQKKLADQVTLLVHGEEGLDAAKMTSSILYDNSIEALSKLNIEEALTVFEGAQISELPVELGMTAYGLAMKINCFKSDHDAQRIIPAGGFYINHTRITNLHEVLTPTIHILPNKLTLVRVGKKSYHIVKWIM